MFAVFNLLPLSDEPSFPINPELIRIIRQKSNKKLDSDLHRKLEQNFPDWEGRMNFQQKQGKFYKSAMKKQVELKRLGM